MPQACHSSGWVSDLELMPRLSDVLPLPDPVDIAIHLYNSGWSLVRVGERLGADPTTVLNCLQRPGVVIQDTRWGTFGLDVLAAVRRCIVKQRHLEPILPAMAMLPRHGKGCSQIYGAIDRPVADRGNERVGP